MFSVISASLTEKIFFRIPTKNSQGFQKPKKKVVPIANDDFDAFEDIR